MYISVLIQMILMEDNILQPGAEEKTKPQIKSQKNLEQKKEKKKTKTSTKKINVQDTNLKDDQKKINSLSKDETKQDKNLKKTRGKINSNDNLEKEKQDYSKLDTEKLIITFEELIKEDLWLKNQQDLQQINQLFEQKFQNEANKQKKVFIKQGGKEIDFFFKPEYKKKFDQITFEYRKKKRDYYKKQEATQKINFEKKKNIINEIKKLIDENQIDSNTYKRFRELQESWYNTGYVPRNETQNLWETFRHHIERFYAFLHLDREFRDLDYKHNFEEKLKIIEKAEELEKLADVMKASRDLNILHQKWKNDLGPVAKEHRESLWLRFQKASKEIQTKRQEYQKDRIGIMKENLIKKNDLLKKMKSILEKIPENHNSWQNALKNFNILRDEFKSIGYVPSKSSKTLWKNFREYGTEFMRKKNLFYKEQKNTFNININEKKEIINLSKNILESENWDNCVEEMKSYQKKWKMVGFIPRKIENKLWNDFSGIHKDYFDRLKLGYNRITNEQEKLLLEKKAYLDKIKSNQFDKSIESIESQLEEHFQNWKDLGALDKKNELKFNQIFSKNLTTEIKNADLEKDELKQVIKTINTQMFEYDSRLLDIEYDNIKSQLSNLKSELTQLENNLEFFSNSSTENPLFKNVEKQIKSCEKKIEKFQDEYIYLKKIKSAKIKKAELIEKTEDEKKTLKNQEDSSSGE
ncbi:MAG: DUF349 domain-containing protein [Flavobacteriaceae bacterium]